MDSDNRPSYPPPPPPPPPIQPPSQAEFDCFRLDVRLPNKIHSQYGSRKANRTLGQQIVSAAMIGFFVGLPIGGVFGAAASQYFPLLGAFSVFGEPFSPARLSYLPSHCIVFGLAAGVVFAVFAGLMKYLSTNIPQ